MHYADLGRKTPREAGIGAQRMRKAVPFRDAITRILLAVIKAGLLRIDSLRQTLKDHAAREENGGEDPDSYDF